MKMKKKSPDPARSLYVLRNRAKGEKPPFPSPRVIMSVLLLAILAFLGVQFARYMIVKSPMFVLKRVEVTGTRFVDKQEILQLASFQPGKRLFQVPIAEAARKIRRNPYLQGVSVSRSLPSTIIISVQEREPVAYLIDQQVYMIDEYGIILQRKPGMSISNLPLITGLSVKSLLKNRKPLFDALRLVDIIQRVDTDLFQFVSEIHIGEKLPPRLYLIRGGAQVEIGFDQYARRIYVLSEFVKNSTILTQLDKIKKIDLTFKDRIIVTRKS